MTDFYIGCHLSSSGGFSAMAKTAHSINANTFQFFTRNPRGGKAKDISDEDIAEFHRLCSEYSIGKIVAHSPYTLNPCPADEKTTRVRPYYICGRFEANGKSSG